MDHQKEPELVARARTADPDALTELFGRYEPLLRATVTRAPGAADLYQEAALSMVELVRRYEPGLGVAFGTFLERHLRWLVANNRRARQQELRQTIALDDDLQHRLEEGEIACSEVPAGLAAQQLAEALGGLRAGTRAIFVRHYLGGDSPEAIARDLGLEERSVYRLLQRAEERIRRAMSDE